MIRFPELVYKFFGLIGIFCCLPVFAQAVTFVEQAERLQLIYAHLLDFRPSSAPETVESSRLEAGADLLWLPTVNNKIGDKEEKIDSPPLIPRPRLRWIHSSDALFGGFWIPPLKVNGYTVNLYGVEGGYRYEWKDIYWGGRVAYSNGNIDGPITEKDTADKFLLTRIATDFSAGYKYKNIWGYLGAGLGKLNTQLDIKSDGVTLKVDNHSYYYGFAGLSYTWNQWIGTFEQGMTETFLRHYTISLMMSF